MSRPLKLLSIIGLCLFTVARPAGGTETSAPDAKPESTSRIVTNVNALGFKIAQAFAGEGGGFVCSPVSTWLTYRALYEDLLPRPRDKYVPDLVQLVSSPLGYAGVPDKAAIDHDTSILQDELTRGHVTLHWRLWLDRSRATVSRDFPSWFARVGGHIEDFKVAAVNQDSAEPRSSVSSWLGGVSGGMLSDAMEESYELKSETAAYLGAAISFSSKTVPAFDAVATSGHAEINTASGGKIPPERTRWSFFDDGKSVHGVSASLVQGGGTVYFFTSQDRANIQDFVRSMTAETWSSVRARFTPRSGRAIGGLQFRGSTYLDALTPTVGISAFGGLSERGVVGHSSLQLGAGGVRLTAETGVGTDVPWCCWDYEVPEVSQPPFLEHLVAPSFIVVEDRQGLILLVAST